LYLSYLSYLSISFYFSADEGFQDHHGNIGWNDNGQSIFFRAMSAEPFISSQAGSKTEMEASPLAKKICHPATWILNKAGTIVVRLLTHFNSTYSIYLYINI